MPRIPVVAGQPQIIAASAADQKTITGQSGTIAYSNTAGSGTLTNGTPVTVDRDTTVSVSSGRGYVFVADVFGVPDTITEASLPSSVAKTTEGNTFTGNQRIEGRLENTGRVTLGSTSYNARIPFNALYGISADTGGGTTDHTGFYVRTIMSGNWAADTGPNPGYAWGFGVYAKTGTAAGDGDDLAYAAAGIIEYAVASPDAVMGTVIGLHAEATFAESTSTGATVTDMRSLHVGNPRRKDGATGGTATNAYGLYVNKVTAADVGATTAFSVFVAGGSNRIGGATEFRATDDIAQVPVVIRAYPSSTARLLTFQNGGGADLGGVTYLGGLNMGSAINAYIGTSNQASLAIYNDGSTNYGALRLGSASDTTLYRVSAGVFGLPDGQHLAVGTTTGTKIATTNTQKLGFFGATPVVRPTLSYSRTGEHASTAAIRTALSDLGLVLDSTTA